MITIAVQVNGKLRGTLKVATNTSTSKDKIRKLASKISNVKKYLVNKKKIDCYYVTGKVINFVIK